MVRCGLRSPTEEKNIKEGILPLQKNWKMGHPTPSTIGVSATFLVGPDKSALALCWEWMPLASAGMQDKDKNDKKTTNKIRQDFGHTGGNLCIFFKISDFSSSTGGILFLATMPRAQSRAGREDTRQKQQRSPPIGPCKFPFTPPIHSIPMPAGQAKSR